MKKKRQESPQEVPKHKVNPQKKRKQDVPEKNYPGLEEKTDKVEGILEQIDKRFNNIEAEFVDLKNEIKADFTNIEDKFGKKTASIEDKISRVEDRISGLESKVEIKTEGLSTETKSNFKWLVGIGVGTWIATMSALIVAILIIILKVT